MNDGSGEEEERGRKMVRRDFSVGLYDEVQSIRVSTVQTHQSRLWF